MTRSRELQLLGALLVVLLGVLWWRGYLIAAVLFLDAHQGFVTGVAALVTAVATIVIAYFTRGTWELFRFEEEKRAATEARIRSRIKRFSSMLAFGYGILAGALKRPEGKREDWYEAVQYTLLEPIERLSRDLPNLIDSAQQSSVELSSFVSTIQASVDSLHRTLPESGDGLRHSTDEWLTDMNESVRELISRLEQFHHADTKLSEYADKHAERFEKLAEVEDLEERFIHGLSGLLELIALASAGEDIDAKEFMRDDEAP